jgi:hypothetical protein
MQTIIESISGSRFSFAKLSCKGSVIICNLHRHVNIVHLWPLCWRYLTQQLPLDVLYCCKWTVFGSDLRIVGHIVSITHSLLFQLHYKRSWLLESLVQDWCTRQLCYVKQPHTMRERWTVSATKSKQNRKRRRMPFSYAKSAHKKWKLKHWILHKEEYLYTINLKHFLVQFITEMQWIVYTKYCHKIHIYKTLSATY